MSVGQSESATNPALVRANHGPNGQPRMTAASVMHDKENKVTNAQRNEVNEEIAAKMLAAKGYQDLTVEPIEGTGQFRATAFVTIDGLPRRAQAMGRTAPAAAHELVLVVTRK
jgi:hypothetical protein